MTTPRSSRIAAWVGGWLGLLALMTTQPGFAQGTLYTLFTNGPTAKRINVVVLAEGYTVGQTNLFLADATNALNSLLAQQPYLEYKSYFNAFAIFVVSTQAGSDHPLSGSFKNTYFNSSFDSYGNPALLTIPPNSFDANSANGQGKVNTLLMNLMPEYDLPLMVVNDLEYGGSGGATLISSVNFLAPEIIVHESGHTLGALADEYDSGAPGGYVPIEKPNATAITISNSIKWRVWIPGGTAIPTPEDGTNATRVGLFQGAQYQAAGWYRPKLDCKMQNLFVDFCEVCSEQLVKSFYAFVPPTDTYSPAATSFATVSTQAVSFNVSPQQPLTHNLTVQWYTNGVSISGATNPAFQVWPKALGNGAHTIRAIVTDPTGLVRTDPTGLLKGTNTWTLNVSLNELSLISARYLATNRFRFTVTGTAPQGFVIQASTNLVNWTPLATNTLTAGKFDFTNSNLTNLTRRFYRTISPP